MVRLTFLLALLVQSDVISVHGSVVDPAGLPVVGALVEVKGTSIVDVSDEHGNFRLIAPPTQTFIVVATVPGFGTRETEVERRADLNLRIQLDLARPSEQISVEEKLPSPAESGAFSISALDVVRTPGAQADMLRALQSLPGLAQVDEGAGLFVRGGDTSEVLVQLDGATVIHPYRYETPTGGFRGAVDPFMTSGISFSTGGFSAKYGNAMSAVLDLHGLSKPEALQISATSGLAGVSGIVSEAIGVNGGFRLSANRALPSLLFTVNPSPKQFDQYPGGWDLAGGADYNSKSLGALKVFGLDQRDHVGVEIDKDAFNGILHSATQHQLLSALWQRPIFNRWQITGAFGHDGYTQTLDVGVMDLADSDHHNSSRVDLEGPAGGWTIGTGFEFDSAQTSIDGHTPVRGGDYAGVSGEKAFTVNYRDRHEGGYAEASRTLGRLTPTFGLRVDRFGHSQSTTLDPRASVAFELASEQHIRLAWGIYHQAPSAAYYDTVGGAVRLPPMMATHYIVGYELGGARTRSFLRIESYYKAYRRLPLQSDVLGFTADGYGSSSGVDVFVRHYFSRVELRGSASALDARRRWTSSDQQDRYPLPPGTWRPDFAIPLSAEGVANVSVAGPFSLGGSWRIASGRPDTPVVGAQRTDNGYQPIYASINSERLPYYERFDLSASVLVPISSGGLMVLFASVDNLLARNNFFEYAYSADYGKRTPVVTTAPRSIYFGVSITR